MTVTVSNREEDSMNNEPSLSGKQIIGIIYPPPDIRTIVDKTAAFVARNGVDFENKIREKEANNPRFNFLSPTDPYNAYYQHKVRELQDGKVVESSIPKPQLPEAVKQHVKKAEFVPTKPPSPYEFSADPATINAYDLDLIRLTAIFVARNGRQFLTQLMNREIRNYQFDFLKPQHSNFSYFTKLVEQYTKVIIPTKTIVDDLKKDAQDSKSLLDDCRYRCAWEKHQRGLKEKEEAAAEKERMAYAQIDWHDFVVVQTVDFQPHETANLPGLCTPKDVGARVLLEAREEQNKAAAAQQTVEMDMDESDSDDEIHNEVASDAPAAQTRAAYEVTQPAPAAPTKHDVTIRDYDPKKALAAKKDADKWLVSPLTGERVRADQVDQHVRYNTVDSQYKEDRDRFQAERSAEEPVFAPGHEIGKHLGRFAERRSDIFGVGGEQEQIGRKIGEEEVLQAPPTRNPGQTTLEQQISEIQRQHGYQPPKQDAPPPQAPPPAAAALPPQAPPPAAAALPPMPPPVAKPPMPPAAALPPPMARPPVMPPVMRPPMGMPMPLGMPIPGLPPIIPPMVGGMPLPMGMGRPMMPPRGPPTDAPPAKRAKTEDDLIPENQWLDKVSGDIEVRVQLPVAEEFSLHGEVVAFHVAVDHPVSTLKELVHNKYGIPTNKQKLSHDGLFMKDACSFAFYNMSNMALVILNVKQRGGKK